MISAKKMANWWRTDLGQYVFEQEKASIKRLHMHINGYFQTQVYGDDSLLPHYDRPCCQFLIAENADVASCAEFLPLKSNSVDTLILPHVLEFSSEPHQVLREAERVLCNDGTLVLCNFKPFSLWGLRRLFSLRKQMPWQGHYFPRSRIKDWLALLNFEIIALENEVFIPPLSSESSLQRAVFLEKWGKRFWPRFAAVSIIVAKKRVIPLTPVSLVKRTKALFPSGGLIKPVTGYNTSALNKEND